MACRREKIFELAKGYQNRNNRCWSTAVRTVEKGLSKAHYDRNYRADIRRKHQNTVIEAAAKEGGTCYSHLMHNIARSRVLLDRKVLHELALNEPLSFRSLVTLSEAIQHNIAPLPPAIERVPEPNSPEPKFKPKPVWWTEHRPLPHSIPNKGKKLP